ncbi:MAG TPA: T9SS type A sorting domain-containing protein [Bacteroidia bacterium]|nr:T9SS type A sorting domain-containing protein [Bacteroidia bacterium]
MKKLLTLLAVVFTAHILSAQTKINEAIGGPGQDEAIYAETTTDGGYVIVGWTTSYGVWGWDIYLVKTDSLGAIEWTKTYGANGDEVDCFVQQTTDGGFIITARSNSFGAGSTDVYLIKTDPAGNLQWTKTIGGSDWDEGHAVLQTPDGGYIHTGYTRSFGAGGDDVYLMKNDSAGNLLWTKTYGGAGDEHGHFIQQTIDGGYIIGGETNSFGAGGWDYYLVKFDVSGNLQWSKTYGSPGDDHGWSVQQVPSDSGYIIGGFTNGYGTEGEDALLIRTDAGGNVTWSKTYGGASADEAYAVHLCSDGGFIIAGNTKSFGAGNTDVYLVKTDRNGNAQWSKTYGGSGNDACQSVQQTNDGGFLIAGYTTSFGMGGADFYMIKTDSLGNSSGCNETSPLTNVFSQAIVAVNAPTLTGSGGICGTPVSLQNSGGLVSQCVPTGINELTSKSAFGISPNPNNGTASVSYSLDAGKTGCVRIYDMTGKCVSETMIQSAATTASLDLSQLDDGIYFCRMFVDGVATGGQKIMITR